MMTNEGETLVSISGDEELQYGCGYEYDHTVRDLGEGHWECAECGTEGWDQSDQEDLGSCLKPGGDVQ